MEERGWRAFKINISEKHVIMILPLMIPKERRTWLKRVITVENNQVKNRLLSNEDVEGSRDEAQLLDTVSPSSTLFHYISLYSVGRMQCIPRLL